MLILARSRLLGVVLPILLAGATPAEAQGGRADIERLASAVAADVVAWRHEIHRHPELSNREVRTAKLVASHLRRLGLEVREGVAHTGVVGVLKGARPGPVVALRADMDALPVSEPAGLPYASTVRTTYNGQDVGVMHACGHDAHTVILMGTASVLAAMRPQLAGTILFVFQPAEEGPPEGEEGGAALMLKEGVFRPHVPEAVFGLHVRPGVPGRIYYRAGGMMASSDIMTIVVRGRQTHAASPWRGIDPIGVAADIVGGLQSMVTREFESTKAPLVVSVGSIRGGIRSNIIPEEVVLSGTVRVLDPGMRDSVLAAIRRRVNGLAASAGATATVSFADYTPPVHNPPELLDAMLPTLEWAAGANGIATGDPSMASEDFALLQRSATGLFFNLGISPAGVAPEATAPNHSPAFVVNDEALQYGVRALAGLAADYASAAPKLRKP